MLNNLCKLLCILCFSLNAALIRPPLDEQREETVYFLSSSLPAQLIGQLARSAEKHNIPIYFQGLINNSVDATAKYLFSLIQIHDIKGILIDPVRFNYYHIHSVPALVKRCGERFDVVYGTVAIEESLKIIQREGECR